MNIESIQKLDRVHSYPAKFTVDLAMSLIQKYTNVGDVVYDPFLGSGTTTLAAKILNRYGYGTDINHIGILISKFKLLELSEKNILSLQQFIDNFKKTYSEEINNIEMFNYESINHWFCEDSIRVLSLIKKNIQQLSDDDEQIFCKLVMSSIVNSVSNQESDTRYAAIQKSKLNVDYVAQLYIKKFNHALEIYKESRECLGNKLKSKVYLYNSKKCTDVVPEDSVDLILTSPPYPNTYDYYLYHKHRMNWLDCDVNFSMQAEIGSRREFSSLKKPKEKFDNDMFEILFECNKVLKQDGTVILVMGDGKIQGKIYDAKINMEKICSKLNWKLVNYSFTMLDDTSRSFQQSYRTKGKKEHVLVFKKT